MSSRISARSLRMYAPTLQVLLDGQLGKSAASLRDVGDAAPGHLLGTHADQLGAAHVDAALAVDHLADRPDRRGLARAVGAEQDDDLAFVDMQVDITEHLDRAVAGIEARDLQHRGHRFTLT